MVKKKKKKVPSAAGSSRAPSFLLKENLLVEDSGESGSSGGHSEAMPQLMNLFGHLGLQTVEKVVADTSGDLCQAVQRLSFLENQLTLEDTGLSSVVHEQDSTAAASARASGERDGLWDLLPEDCKRIIWGYLSRQDLARAAATSEEWYMYSKEALLSCKWISVLRNAAASKCRGMVSAYCTSANLKIDYRGSDNAFFSADTPEGFFGAIRRGQEDRWESRGEDSLKIERVMVFGHGNRFNGEELESLLENLDYIDELLISNCPEVGDDQLEMLSRYERIARCSQSDMEPEFRCMSRLAIVGSKISTRGLKYLMGDRNRTCLNHLLFLDISQSRKITELIAPRPRSNLRSLVAKCCPNLKKVDLRIPGCCLSQLNLQDCRNLTELNIDCSLGGSELKGIIISGCTQLKNISLNCPELTTLQASKCSKLQLSGAEIVRICCPKLEEVHLNACRSLDNDGLSLLLGKLAVGLRTLNVGGCIYLTRIQAVFQGVHGCSLDAYGCSNLKTVEITSPTSLSKLVLSGCSNLQRVTVTGPAPSIVQKKHCKSI